MTSVPFSSFFFHSLLPSYPSPYYELEGPVGWTFARVMLKGKHSAYIPLSPALSTFKEETDLTTGCWWVRWDGGSCSGEIEEQNLHLTLPSLLHCRQSWIQRRNRQQVCWGTRDGFASLWKIRKKLRDCEVEMLFFNIITFTSQSLNFFHCRHSWSMKMWTPLHTSYYFPLLHYFLLHLRICQH